MGFDLNRWLKYAKARVDSAVGEGHRSLDRLEAEREAEQADKPWLGSDGKAPTLEEARARIEWEAEKQRSASAPPDPPQTPSTGDDGSLDAASRTPGGDGASGQTPEDASAAAEQSQARLELARREQASAERLRAIRAELGVEDPPSTPTDP